MKKNIIKILIIIILITGLSFTDDVLAVGPTVINFYASPMSVPYNGSTTLTWSSSGIDFCTATNDWLGFKGNSGSEVINNITSSKTYRLSCRDFSDNFTEKIVTVTVVSSSNVNNSSSNISVATDDADNITATTAILRGRAGINNIFLDGCTSTTTYSTTTGQICDSTGTTSVLDSTAYFRYSSSPIPPVFCNEIYGSNMTSTKDIFLGKTISASFYQPIRNLTPDTDYYYCAVVSNKSKINYGTENIVKKFHTNCYQTTVNTKNATSIGSTTATLNGIYCSIKDVVTSFEYRKTRDNSTPPEQSTSWQTVGEVSRSIGTKSNLSGDFNFRLSGLESNTKYEFKAVAKTSTENPTTSILEFTTNPPSAGTSNDDGGGFSFSSIFGNIFGSGGTGSGTGTGTGTSGTGTGTGSGTSGSGTGGTGAGGSGTGSSTTPTDTINGGNINSGIFTSGSFSGGNINNGNISGVTVSTSSGNVVTGATLSGVTVSGVTVSSGGGNITSGNIGSGNITSGNIVGGQITVGKLTSGDTTGGITNDGTTSGATITGTVSGATVTTPSGAIITGATISGIMITNATIDSDQNITDGSIQSGDIESGSIQSGNITAGTLTGSTVTGGTINNGNISGAIITTTNNNIITGATLTGANISGATMDGGGNISNGIIASGNMTGGTNAGNSSTSNNGTWGSDGSGAGATSGTWGTGTGSGTWVATSGTGGGGIATWSGSGNGSGTWSSATGSGTWNNGTGTGGAGTGTWGNLVLGQKAVPPNDAIVRYHEGIETVFTRQIINNPIYQNIYGYKTGDDLLTFAWNLSHQFAQMFGYVNQNGREIRVSYPDIAAYQLQLIGNKLTVYEYYAEKIVDIRNLTTVFKNASGYEYYFQK